ncbi:MAG: YfhO family protein [Candidatus Levybacteria bacterium]|nr:YfhO family protein [Candidatus Levybacteria bacterium]
MIKKILPLGILTLIVLFFFRNFFLEGMLPVPSDTIVGLYHPFRDFYAKDFPNGIPFRNFLITDPVRQQYPWRELAISLEKNLGLPLWNPYSGAGMPLLANFQSAPFYPLNFLLFSFPFQIGWTLLIILQPALGAIFLYLYLRNLKLNKLSSILGAVVFAFSGFSIAWMEWGTILHVGLWLPLILLSIDKILQKLNIKKFSIWSVIFIFSLVSSFLAGHLQTFFYVFLFSVLYLIVRWIQFGKNFKYLIIFLISYIVFFVITFVQWFPTLQFILLSARNIDQSSWSQTGWFIPWQNLVQFLSPDFFGNPATLNYWGVWNYGEFIGYVGIFPLMISMFAMFFRHDRKTLFFGTAFFVSLIFALPTFFGKIPFIINLPFISTAHPTRLLFVADFSLAVLASLGFDYFIKSKRKEILYPVIFMALTFGLLWLFIFTPNNIFKSVSLENLQVAKRNLVFPTLLFLTSAFILIAAIYIKLKTKIVMVAYAALIILTVFDLLRFGWKFESFTNKSFLFPQTKTIVFLQHRAENYRIMSLDSRIFPPNFSTVYRLQSVDLYDPLYLRRYGELIAASERGKPDISPPFGFDRIITPHNFESKIVNLLGVKYVLSLSDMSSPNFKKVFQEGQTRVYENKNVLPRAFFAEELKKAESNYQAINLVFDDNINLSKTAIVEGFVSEKKGLMAGRVKILQYSENKVVIQTENKTEGFLVLTDSFYPSWHAKIDSTQTRIYRTDYNFRGVFVPKGEHKIIFQNSLF